MLKIEKNKSLGEYITIGVPARAQHFAVIKNKADLVAAILWANSRQQPIHILGGGSNLLITKLVKGLVIKNEIRGRRIITEDKNEVLFEGKSGEKWSTFVDYTVARGWHGLENLSLIYGTVGAAPIQNIGAYGTELKDSFDHLVAIDLKTGRERVFKRAECLFDYRFSIFKGRLKNRYFIYSVAVRLYKKKPLLLEYGSIKESLALKGIKKPQLKEVAQVIKEIRRSKLPDPIKFPNAGSFFKNVEISADRYKKLLVKHPTVPGWPVGAGKVKIPSGWLIEAAGFKGKRVGPLGMHERQALVMVNYQGAKAKQVVALSKLIKRTVKETFGLDLVEEINII
jgi:UDP-N-acetylmuramate dehydrogenase